MKGFGADLQGLVSPSNRFVTIVTTVTTVSIQVQAETFGPLCKGVEDGTYAGDDEDEGEGVHHRGHLQEREG